MENITKERIWELLNILVDEIMNVECYKMEATIIKLFRLGFTRNELIFLDFPASEVCDLADEYEMYLPDKYSRYNVDV